MPNLENWYKVVAPGGMFAPPDTEITTFMGEVFGHSQFPDGSSITIHVAGYDFQEWAFRDSTGEWYRLKTPAPGYEARFPKSQTVLERAIDKLVYRPWAA